MVNKAHARLTRRFNARLRRICSMPQESGGDDALRRANNIMSAHAGIDPVRALSERQVINLGRYGSTAKPRTLPKLRGAAARAAAGRIQRAMATRKRTSNPMKSAGAIAKSIKLEKLD